MCLRQQQIELSIMDITMQSIFVYKKMHETELLSAQIIIWYKQTTDKKQKRELIRIILVWQLIHETIKVCDK